MNKYEEYKKEILERRISGLHPKPIDDDILLNEIIEVINDSDHIDYQSSIDLLLHNVIPGTTKAAFTKAQFLKDIIMGQKLTR